MDSPSELTAPVNVQPNGAGVRTTPNAAGAGEPSGGEPKISKEMAEILAKDADAVPKEAADASTDIKLVVPERLKDAIAAEDIKLYEDSAREIMKRSGVSAEQAQEFLQGLANLTFDLQRARIDTIEKENIDAVKEQTLAWRREVAADPQLGGHKYNASLALAEEGARRLGGNPGHIAFLRYWSGEEAFPGPLLVKMLHLAAATMREDRINGLILNKGQTKKPLEERLYGPPRGK